MYSSSDRCTPQKSWMMPLILRVLARTSAQFLFNTFPTPKINDIAAQLEHQHVLQRQNICEAVHSRSCPCLYACSGVNSWKCCCTQRFCSGGPTISTASPHLNFRHKDSSIDTQSCVKAAVLHTQFQRGLPCAAYPPVRCCQIDVLHSERTQTSSQIHHTHAGTQQ